MGSSNCAFSQFIYLANASNDVSAYSFDAKTRVLTQAPGSPFAAGMAPAGVAVDSASRFVYVANSGSNDVSAYMIDGATGALTAVALSPFAAGSAPAGVAVDPTGKFLYVANSESSDVSAYMIEAATGALTPVPGSPFAAGSAPAGVAVDPVGKFLYVTNSGSGDVSAYRINPTNGVLTAVPGSPFAADQNAESVAIDPTGRLAYVTSANRRGRSVWVFAIDPASGELAAIPGSALAAGGGPLSVAVHPNGKFVYLAKGGDISAYAASANTGASRLISGSRFTSGLLWSGLVIDPTGKFVYGANDESNNVSVYAVDGKTGVLQPVAESPLGTSRPRGIAVSAATSVRSSAPSGQPLLTAFTPGPARNNFTGGFGMKFTVGTTPLSVTALGRIYIAGNSGTHVVKLVRVSDGADVGSVSISLPPPSDPAGQFTYVSLASAVTLDANASYYLTSDEINGGDQFYDLGPVTATSAVTVNTGIVFWPGFGYIAVGLPTNSYVPANLLYAVPGTPPNVAITAPANGATVSGNNVTVSAAASASLGLTVASVQFQVDGVNQGAPVTTSPYSIVLDTTKLNNATHSLVAIATDSANNATASPAVSITVNNNPTAAITAPLAGAMVSGPVTVSATAAAAAGLTIASVQFKVDTTNLGALVLTSPYSIVLDSTKLTNATHALYAIATDSAGNITTSSPVSITVNNTTTSVAITAPLAGATVSGPITVSATATPGATRTISSVQFQVDNVNKGPAVTSSPYNILLDTTMLSNGMHSLVAVATDSANTTAPSAPIAITVSNSGPPPSGTALIAGFTTGAVRNNFTGGFGMKITVGATPLNVTALGRIFVAGNAGSHVVKLVRVSDGGDVPGGSVTIALTSGTPGQFVYAALASPVTLDANASYYLVSAEFNGGDQWYDLSPVTTTNAASVDSGIVFWPGQGFIAVGPANTTYVPVNLLYSNGTGTPPSVAITAPAAGATVSGNSVTVSASATALNGLAIAGVQFAVDSINQGAPVNASPYSITLDTTKLTNAVHILTAVATDSANNSATSAPVSITVNNNPTVAITTPAPGVTVSGNNVAVSASASAVPGLTIKSVQFKVDTTTPLGAPVTTSPYTIVLDSTKLTNGPHSLIAVATDSANNTTTSAPVSITVANSVTTVVITSPMTGATVSGNMTVTATATPGTGLTISSVQFQVNNANQGAPVTTSPYSIVVDTTMLTNGAYTLSAVATDSSNKTTTSSPVTITVSNGGPPPSGTPLIAGFTAGAVRNNFTGGFGMRFTVGATPLNVVALGRIYITGNTGAHLLKLVRVSDGSDVQGGSVNLTLPSGTAGQFVYAALNSPVTLDANASYYLISAETSGGDQFYDLGPVTPPSVASVDSGIVLWPGNGFIPVGPPNRSYVPINLLYTTGP